MIPLLTDAQFNSIALILIAAIGIIPATMAAVWSRSSRTNSIEANQNAKEARDNSAGTLHEVKANGGMTGPDPTLKDIMKYVGEIAAQDSRRMDRIEELIENHIRHSNLMDSVLAEVFFAVKPDLRSKDLEDLMN